MARKWIVRRGGKARGFRYTHPAGTTVSDAALLERIEALRIPPAWRDVHIAVNARLAIQAWGYDARGRKQYRYHEHAVRRGELRKYHRVRQLARDLPAIRRKVDADRRREEPTREKVSAAVVRLIAEGFFRVGSERYAKENKTFGIATLRKSHMKIEGDCIAFQYTGKRAILQRQVIVDAELAAFLTELARAPGRRLFRYRSEEGWCDLTARDVNTYLRRIAGVPYTAKDFRTWGGTLRLATVLADLGPPASDREAKRNVVLAVRLVAAELGNTPAICRKSYVHPMVIARYLDDGITIARDIERRPRRKNGAPKPRYAHTPEERALIAFLDRYFPERREKPRAEEAAA
ncbi:MAG: DNA topoisomerase IB [Gemmatimonadaceae bacterium]